LFAILAALAFMMAARSYEADKARAIEPLATQPLSPAAMPA
jgi:hypothetical protein